MGTAESDNRGDRRSKLDLGAKTAHEIRLPDHLRHVALSELNNIYGDRSPQRLTDADGSNRQLKLGSQKWGRILGLKSTQELWLLAPHLTRRVVRIDQYMRMRESAEAHGVWRRLVGSKIGRIGDGGWVLR